MRRDEALSLLRAHHDELEHFGVKRLALFGSVARDEARADSDVDLLVEFQGPGTFDRYMGLRMWLEDLLAKPIHLVTRDAVKPRFWPYIEPDLVDAA